MDQLNKRPPATGGLRHVALNVTDMAACEQFYVGLLGMAIEWRPDAENMYLSSGCDNLALHRVQKVGEAGQRLDHIGFILRRAEDVDAWFEFLQAHEVPIAQPPRTHRDGARSFYCRDPQGNLVQMIHHPPIAQMCP
ncbi:MAG: VOC family protein [Gammaproteobacteria bacterium]